MLFVRLFMLFVKVERCSLFKAKREKMLGVRRLEVKSLLERNEVIWW